MEPDNWPLLPPTSHELVVNQLHCLSVDDKVGVLLRNGVALNGIVGESKFPTTYMRLERVMGEANFVYIHCNDIMAIVRHV